MKDSQLRSEFEKLYGKGNPILDELCHEFLPPHKDFSVVFESNSLEPGERHKIDMQLPSALIINPDILLRFDENEIRKALEVSNLEVGKIEKAERFSPIGLRFHFITPNGTTIKFFRPSLIGYCYFEISQQTQPPYEALISFVASHRKGEDIRVGVSIREIGLKFPCSIYSENYILESLLRMEIPTLPPEGQAWDDDSKRGRYPLNAARIFQ